MKELRPVLILLAMLIALEAGLFLLQSPASLSTIRDEILVGFLFGVPTLLIGGLVAVRKHWIVMAAVMYSTIALALDLATIVQEASQPSPRAVVLALTVGSSVLNLLVMIFGGRCALAFQPNQAAAEGSPTNVQSHSL